MRRPTTRAQWLALAALVALSAPPVAAENPMPSGYPGRGRIGIEVQPMTAELREYFRAPVAQGVLIVRVEAGRPADVAELRVGDVVIAAAGEPLVRPQDLIAIVARAPGGEPLALTVVRKRKTRTIQVVPDGPPATQDALEEWHDRVGTPLPASAPAVPDPAAIVPAPVPAAPAPANPPETPPAPPQ